MRDFFANILNYANTRLIIMFVVICGLFFTLVVKLYDLQIINGDYYSNEVKGTTIRDIEVTAPRGSIYDRYGRPLAVNKSSYIVLNIFAFLTTNVFMPKSNSKLSSLIIHFRLILQLSFCQTLQHQ